ncbi:MAG: hypothetical protein SFV22_15465 [Saprospiraceae bacterium]|nr:hypothetical protein [Saprospiraceae bacterium]
MKNLFLILVVGLAISSCSKDEATPNTSEISVPSPSSDRNPTLQVIGDGGTQSLTCGWSDGYGSGQVACAGDHCALTTMTISGTTYVGITCYADDVPLHTDNYRGY